MYTINTRLGVWSLLGMAMLFTACSRNKVFKSPKGYDLNNPQRIIMPASLHEISGITFYQGRTDTVYAEQDEDGRLFYLKPGDKKAESFHFGKHGDYEDVAICNGYVIMLKSDGKLYTFPMTDIHGTETDHVVEWKDLLPQGEYEGMYADETNRLIYILCKHCQDEKTTKIAQGYIFQLSNDGKISQSSSFVVNIQDVEALTGEKKINFHPSALGHNPRTNEWYIVSSVNKLLVVADNNWKVTAVYKLNPALYIQPEGIAFDKDNNLYISNEGGDLHAGNILKITYAGK